MINKATLVYARVDALDEVERLCKSELNQDILNTLVNEIFDKLDKKVYNHRSKVSFKEQQPMFKELRKYGFVRIGRSMTTRNEKKEIVLTVIYRKMYFEKPVIATFRTDGDNNISHNSGGVLFIDPISFKTIDEMITAIKHHMEIEENDLDKEATEANKVQEQLTPQTEDDIDQNEKFPENKPVV